MKIAGIVIAKKYSSRFPGKNMYSYKGIPLFWHSVRELYALRDYYDVDICVATNSTPVATYCGNNSADIFLVWRGANIIENEQPLFEVLKYAWQSLDNSYNAVVCMLANSIGHAVGDIQKAVELITKHRLMEVRGYGKDGVENGLLVLSPEVFKKHELSVYVGAITTKAKEVHYEKDLA